MVHLTPELMLRAYAVGIFPMAASAESPVLYWFDPDMRGILPFDSFHLPRRLRRTVRQKRFEVRINSAFEEVVNACAAATSDRPKTWINAAIRDVYRDLCAMGYAHSVECWDEEGLAGGLYGVALAGAFFGESMFSRRRDASKVALVHLVARLRKGGFRLLDTQFVTEHLNQFGAIEIPRSEYRARLAEALTVPAVFACGCQEELTAELLSQLETEES